MRLLTEPAAQTWAICAVVVAILWGILVTAITWEWEQSRQEQRSLAASTAKGFAEYVGLHVLIIDRLVQGVRAQRGPSPALPPHDALTAELGYVGPLLVQLAHADREGKVVASSLPLTVPVSIADRPHFRAFRDDPRDRLHISQPVVGRVSGKMSIQLVRPLFDGAGRFDGVLVASIDPLKLQAYFREKDALSGGSAVLIAGRHDGVVRARFTANDITWGQSLLKSVGWELIATREFGTYEGLSVIDGRDRIVAFQHTHGYPLFISVSTPARDWLLVAMDRFRLAFALALIMSLLLVLVTRMRVRGIAIQQETIHRLEQSRQREAEANQIKSHFLASVSHELRTPLNSILGFSELIREQTLEPRTHRYADLIHGSGNHLHAVVNTLLDLAKIEAGRMEVSSEDIDLGLLLGTTVDMHRVSAEKKGLRMALAREWPDGSAVIAVTDRTKLVQVLNNVLHNAVKFTDEGSIQVSARLQDDSLHIRVVDTGVGIPAERLSLVFDRFSQAASGAGTGEGSGLGLPLSRELMMLLGGCIEVQSTAGGGTQVDIRVPNVRLVKR
jgi:signal transduction histidine kinase